MSEPANETATPPSPNGVLVPCPCCFSLRAADDIVVVRLNNKVVLNACSACVARAFSWAATSSLGFVLRPVENSKPADEQSLESPAGPSENNSEQPTA